MRMRKKPNLEARMERCADLLVKKPEEMRGRWRELMPEAAELPGRVGVRQGPLYH